MNKPIGCRAFHFIKKVGQDEKCMYCGEVFLKFVTVLYKPTGHKFTFRPLPLFKE